MGKVKKDASGYKHPSVVTAGLKLITYGYKTKCQSAA